MKRLAVPPRANWQAEMEAIEFFGWRRDDGSAYWVEDACFELSEDEVEVLHEAATVCERLVNEAVARAIGDRAHLARLGLDNRLATLAQVSWRRGDPTLYGRFDFAWGGVGPPKLLEYNADTPTALYEAAVVQWRWLNERDPGADQYNAIHERLIDAWRALSPAIAKGGRLHLSSMRDDVDDATTTAYLADCAKQAGIETQLIDIAGIGLKGRLLVDLDDRPITHLFKLYPWEWLTAEEDAFAAALLATDIGVLEPPWRVAAASKGLLVDLWNATPDCPYLLPASWREGDIAGDRVGKAILGREGANIRTHFGGVRAETDGPFVGQSTVWQARATMPAFDGRTPVFGVWTVAGEPCGLGIREDTNQITGRGAWFIPHRMA